MADLGVHRDPALLKSVGYPSLFQADSEDELSSDSGSERDYHHTQPSHLPMHEVITAAPKTLASLLESLLPRLQPSADVKGVSLQDQKNLANVLVGELASQFSVIQHQIDDPFLNPQQNKDLHRRVVVQVCEILEQLYQQFLVKAAAIISSGVFSAAANLSRVKAELTLEANKRLNIPLIRRQVLTQIRGALPSIGGESPSGHVIPRKRIKERRLPPIPRQERRKKAVRRLSLNDLKLGEPLSTKMNTFGVRLESGAVSRRINKLQSRLPRPPSEYRDEDTPLSWDEASEHDARESPDKYTSTASRLGRVSSMPELWRGFLLCDMGLISRTDRVDKRGQNEALGVYRPPSVGRFMDLRLDGDRNSLRAEQKQLGEYTTEDMSKDLQDLCFQSTVSKDTVGVDELHPLLQAHGHGLSVQAAQRLAQHDAERRRTEEVLSVGETDREGLESRIPSVPTLDQLPYLDFQHSDSEGSSSHPSLHVKSGPSLIESQSLSGPSDPSQLLTDFGESFSDSMPSFEPSGLVFADTLDMVPPSEHTASMQQYRPSQSQLLSAHGGSAMDMEASATSLHTSGPAGQEAAPGPPSPTPQPAVLTTRFGQSVVRTTDVRVSERTPLNELRLKLFGPIYNQITGELDSSMIEELDSSLHEGQEVREVYQEIMKTLSTKHLQFTEEPTLEPAIDVPVDLSHILASDTLHHRRSRRVINKSLYRSIPHPWGQDTSRKDWEKSNQYQGPDLDQHGITRGGGAPLSPRLAHISRAYNTWANWWNSTANAEDYLKYTSREESDYLRLVYHLYDSEGSDSEAEEEARLKKEKLELLHKKLKAKEARRRQRYSAKSRYEAGVWNVNTVMMGGLGGDPECSTDEEELASPITDQEQTVTPEEIQERLAEVWRRLEFPHSLQMDMVIKYSNPRQSTRLDKALCLWEDVAGLIEKREALLTELEKFEREASDPSRFFSKGSRGSSSTRLSEARKRDSLHKGLDLLDKDVSHIVQRLHKDHGDIVTYKGRPYRTKMSSDRTEMLYWLQQERRAVILKPASVVLSLDQTSTGDRPARLVVHVPSDTHQTS